MIGLLEKLIIYSTSLKQYKGAYKLIYLNIPTGYELEKRILHFFLFKI